MMIISNVAPLSPVTMALVLAKQSICIGNSREVFVEQNTYFFTKTTLLHHQCLCAVLNEERPHCIG